MNKRKSCVTYLYQDSLARRTSDEGARCISVRASHYDRAFTLHNPYGV